MKYRIEMSATKVVEVTVDDDEIGAGDESLEQVAELKALDNAFHNDPVDQVKTVEDWDLTVETMTELKL